MTPWPWQTRMILEAADAIDRGERALCLSAPTGTGKRYVIGAIAKQCADRGMDVLVFLHRRLLTKQTFDEFRAADLPFGVIAAGYEADRDAKVQVVSVQTFDARFRRKLIGLPPARVVLIDECHIKSFDSIVKEYAKEGTTVLGLTATPVDLAGRYDRLVVACKMTEARDHKALVMCETYSPSEPDMKGVKKTAVGEYEVNGARKRIWQTRVYADVWEHWDRLNPFRAPTLLFAPGVDESRWFVREFRNHGITAEHIDGETSEAERQRIIEGSKNGSIVVVSSYGVLREGADWPWITHGILVQGCGALSTFKQIVGRLLRAYPGKDKALLQDHSGAAWRHGSPNADVDWVLGVTDKELAKRRISDMERGDVPQPIRCPKCGRERSSGTVCPTCGHEHAKSVRLVRTIDGELVRRVGDVVKKKPAVGSPQEAQKVWTQCLWAAGASGQTVNQALGNYWRKTGQNVPVGVKPMPEPGSNDWSRRVADVWPWFRGRVSA